MWTERFRCDVYFNSIEIPSSGATFSLKSGQHFEFVADSVQLKFSFIMDLPAYYMSTQLPVSHLFVIRSHNAHFVLPWSPFRSLPFPVELQIVEIMSLQFRVYGYNTLAHFISND